MGGVCSSFVLVFLLLLLSAMSVQFHTRPAAIVPTAASTPDAGQLQFELREQGARRRAVTAFASLSSSLLFHSRVNEQRTGGLLFDLSR